MSRGKASESEKVNRNRWKGKSKMPVGEVKNLVNKLEVEVESASLSIVLQFHLVSGARQGRHPEGGSVRSPPPPRPPRLHQHRPHTLVALHCPP